MQKTSGREISGWLVVNTVDGKTSVEFVNDPNQGLGESCHQISDAYADAVPGGRIVSRKTFNDKPKTPPKDPERITQRRPVYQ